jgi:hypothetical protein
VHQAERRKLVFQSQASGDAGCGLWHIRGTSAKTPKKAKIEANALKHGSKVATTFQRCLIIKHLCNKPLAFESSASANSATPALGTGAKGYEIHVQAQHPRAGECAVLSAFCLHGKTHSAQDSGHYSRSSPRKPRGGPRISRRIIASRKPDVDASNVAMFVLSSFALAIVGVTPA